MADLCGPTHSSGNVPENIGISGGTGPGTAGGAFVPTTGPRLLEWSPTIFTARVQHENTTPCDGEPGGTIARLSHSRFRVAHGLSGVTGEMARNITVVPMVKSVLVASPGSGNQLNDQDTIPDIGTSTGYNAVRWRNTTARAMVCVNTCDPIADEKYSYVTIGYPVTAYPLVINTNTTSGNGDMDVPEYCGNVVTASSQFWWGESVGTSDSGMSIRMDVQTCAVTATHGSGGPFIYGPPRTIGLNVRPRMNFDKGFPLLVNSFLGIPNGSTITIQVNSFLYDAPSVWRIYSSPSPEAHPAP